MDAFDEHDEQREHDEIVTVWWVGPSTADLVEVDVPLEAAKSVWPRRNHRGVQLA